MRRTLTITRTVAVYLLLGFVTTWAVAWGLALLPPGREDPTISAIHFFRGIYGSTRLGIGSSRVDYKRSPEGLENLHHSMRTLRMTNRPESIGWSRLHAYSDLGNAEDWGMRYIAQSNDRKWQSGVDDARGFPLLSHWCSWEFQSESLPGLQTDLLKEPPAGGISIPGYPNPALPLVSSVRALPYYPIWSGLLLNTAFYAFIFFAVVRTTRAFKQSLRHARGLCPRCRYDRQHDYRLPCPECGQVPRVRKIAALST